MNMRSLASISDLMLELPRNQGHAGEDEALLSRVGHGLLRQFKRSIRGGQRLARLPGALLARREGFNCPICSYTGPFIDTGPTSCRMFDDQCLWCGALSGHRLQYCALAEFSEPMIAGAKQQFISRRKLSSVDIYAADSRYTIRRILIPREWTSAPI